MRAIVTVGIPACGKSTYARRLAALGFVEINRDHIRRQVGGGFGVPRIEAAVTRIAQGMLADAARRGHDVIVSDTNVTRRGRKDVTRLLRKFGFDRVEAHVFDVALDLCLARNVGRPDEVPEHVLLAMSERLARQPPWLTDGFDTIVRVVPGRTEPQALKGG